MSKQKVLLLGATGETGTSIVEGLLEQKDKFEIEALIRPSSVEKPSVKQLNDRGVKIRVGDIGGSIADLTALLEGFDTVISAIDATSQLAQISLATAAKLAGIKRFVPCAFTVVAPPGNVMLLRDDKEQVYQHVRKLFLPYTIIDVGFWYQFSFPTVPSGRVDYASLRVPYSTIHVDGDAPNLLTDLRDIGKFVARIIADERTLNKFVLAYGDILSENNIFAAMEEASGEVIERNFVSTKEIEDTVDKMKKLYESEPTDPMNHVMIATTQYEYSKYVRRDNQLEYAKYLGYIDARDLYPDFKPKSFKNFLKDLLDGKIARPYPQLRM